MKDNLENRCLYCINIMINMKEVIFIKLNNIYINTGNIWKKKVHKNKLQKYIKKEEINMLIRFS